MVYDTREVEKPESTPVHAWKAAAGEADTATEAPAIK
jgi:hypothetical protein